MSNRFVFYLYFNLFYEDIENINSDKKYEYIKLFNYYIEKLNENNLNDNRNKLWFDLNNLEVDNNNGINAYQQIGYISKLFNVFKSFENYCIKSNNRISLF